MNGLSHTASCAALQRAAYSASAVESGTEVCFLFLQKMVAPHIFMQLYYLFINSIMNLFDTDKLNFVTKYSLSSSATKPADCHMYTTSSSFLGCHIQLMQTQIASYCQSNYCSIQELFHNNQLLSVEKNLCSTFQHIHTFTLYTHLLPTTIQSAGNSPSSQCGVVMSSSRFVCMA